MPVIPNTLVDKTAMALSGLCLVHCLAGSLLVALFAASGEWLGHNVHLYGLLLALPLAALALWRGVNVHRRMGVAILGASGIALMALSLVIRHGGFAEIAVSISGVTMLALAHLWNMRAGRG